MSTTRAPSASSFRARGAAVLYITQSMAASSLSSLSVKYAWPLPTTRRPEISPSTRTSAVDPSKEHEIREAMGTVMAGRTTFVIAHRPATIALADTVVLLDGGRVTATGTHHELVASNARYRQVLAAMAAQETAHDEATAVAGGA